MAMQTVNTRLKPRCLRLSSNELQDLVKQEREKWRIFRIQQVREQAKQEAQRVREAVHSQERRILDDLQQELELQWRVQKEKKVTQLEKEYHDCMKNIGQAHRQAEKQPDPDEVLQQQAEHNQWVAVLRGREAGKHHREEVKQQKHMKNRHLKQQQDVRSLEKERARHVANLPMPEAFRKKRVKEKKSPPRVLFHEAGTLTTTHYVPHNVKIEKEVWSSKPSAKEKAAMEEAARLREEETQQRQAEEECVKREQRGREALRKEHVTRLLQHLTAGLDEAQHQHHISRFLQGNDNSILKSEDSRLKEHTHQQKQMEEAVEKVLHEEHQRTKKMNEYLGTSSLPESAMQSSDYLEETEASEDMNGTVFKTKVRGLKSLLREIERRRDLILQDVEDSIPVRGPNKDEEDGRNRDQEGNIHEADTLPAHLLPGRPSITSFPKGTAPGLPPLPLPKRRPVGTQSNIGEATDSYSTVLPLSEESIPVSDNSTQPSSSPSLPCRFSTPQEQHTHIHSRQPCLSKLHRTISDSSSSSDIKISIDLDVGSSSLVASDSSLELAQQKHTQSYTSSTEYCSLPSDIPRKMLLQDIEKDLQKIQEHRQLNQDLIDSLSRKRTSPGHHVSTTYMEKLKEDGSGRKPLTRRGKYELQKKALIRFYIQKLLQRGDQEGEISASTLEGSGVSISSLGSFLSFLEGEKQEGRFPPSSSVSISSPSTEPFSSGNNIDEFQMRMVSNDGHLPPHTLSSISSVCSFPDSMYAGPHNAPTTYPRHHNTTNFLSPSLTSYIPSSHPVTSSFSSSTTSSKLTSQHAIKPHPESPGFFTAPKNPEHELSSDNSVSIPVSTISSGSSIAGSSVEKGDGEWIERDTTPRHSCSPPHHEIESSPKDSETTIEHLSTKQADPGARLRWNDVQKEKTRIQHIDTTTTSEDSSRGATTKPIEFPQSNLSHFRVTESIPSVTIQTSTTSSESSTGRVRELSKYPWTKKSDIASNEVQNSSVSSVMSTTTSITPTQVASHSSGESTVSMPDMAEVLRRFGLEKNISSSASINTDHYEEEED